MLGAKLPRLRGTSMISDDLRLVVRLPEARAFEILLDLGDVAVEFSVEGVVYMERGGDDSLSLAVLLGVLFSVVLLISIEGVVVMGGDVEVDSEDSLSFAASLGVCFSVLLLILLVDDSVLEDCVFSVIVGVLVRIERCVRHVAGVFPTHSFPVPSTLLALSLAGLGSICISPHWEV